MEKLSLAPSGFKALLLALGLPLTIVFLLVNSNGSLSGLYVVLLILVGIFDLFIINGITVVQPNYATVLTFFGKYVGTIKQNGLLFVNPLYKKTKVTLRTQSTESSKLKVNDKLGNPIEIAVVILWQISDTYKAIVAARSKIVEGAVGMVEMALDKLSERNIVKLDDEKKAAMVSNLMVVLCGEKSVSPILNTGSM